MSKRKSIAQSLQALSGTNSLRRAGSAMTVLKTVSIIDDGSRQSCELCGTTFKNGALVKFKATGARIVVGGKCLESLLTGHFYTNDKLALPKRQVTARLQKIYSTHADPKSWLSWLADNAPETLAPDVAVILFLGKASSPHSLAKLIRYHDKHRKLLTDALFSPFDFVRTTLKLPKLITLDEYDSVCRRHAQTIDTEIAETILSRYVKQTGIDSRKNLRATKYRKLEAALQLASEAVRKNAVHSKKSISVKGWERADSAKEGSSVWNPKLGVGRLVKREAGRGIIELLNKQNEKSQFALDYWYTMTPKFKTVELMTYKNGAKAFFALLRLAAQERQAQISELEG
jgi:hypothetical protein